MGSLYLFTQEINWTTVLPALSCGFFSIGVLNINNTRDIESDLAAGKYSIPVRIGKKNAARYQWFLLMGGILAAIAYTILNYQSPFQFLFLLSVPLFIRIGAAVTNKPSDELDPYLKQMALSTLAFVILFGAGNLL
ncbi:MAG: UbiA family prenyltransferase [Bacteroidota bacterium]